MKKRLYLTLLGVALGVMLFTANLGLRTATSTPTAEAAAYSIAVSGQQCTSASQVSVSFSWLANNEGNQWFDLSLSNNGFVPGTFVGIGPLASNQTSVSWDGILPGLTHYLRVNTLTPFGWSVSPTIVFTTGDCQYVQSNIAVVTTNQVSIINAVNGLCSGGWYLQNGMCYSSGVLSQSASCQFGGYALGGTCYYPSPVALVNGVCASGSLMQNGQCYAPQTPVFVQSPTCYAGYNQTGQCYDSTLGGNNAPQCINGYINGNVEYGMCR